MGELNENESRGQSDYVFDRTRDQFGSMASCRTWIANLKASRFGENYIPAENNFLQQVGTHI